VEFDGAKYCEANGRGIAALYRGGEAVEGRGDGRPDSSSASSSRGRLGERT
jgi:hypothetical protein